MAIHTLQNKFLSASVNTLGAELISLKTGQQELLWLADKSIWPRHAPVLFPIVGKLKEDSYVVNGKTFKLHQHGFARDKEFVLINADERCLEFELTATEETLKIYPFHFSLIIRYELEEKGVKIVYKIFNPDNTDLYFSIGAHPGFNCKRAGNESLEDFKLFFEGKNELVANKLNGGLISEETYKVPLNNGTVDLSMELFDTDAIVLKNSQVSSVKLFSSKSKPALILECRGWPYFGIWTKKDSDAFVCLEPWYGIADEAKSDGKLTEKTGIITLAAQQSFTSEYKILVE